MRILPLVTKVKEKVHSRLSFRIVVPSNAVKLDARDSAATGGGISLPIGRTPGTMRASGQAPEPPGYCVSHQA
jgi:hypothetical protein